MNPTIYISGFYSGPSPSPGLGVARSIRAALPGAKLVGVDYWAGSSGLHHEVLDDIWLKPSWDLIESELYAEEIRGVLDRGAWWVPTMDLEVAWLAATLGGHERLLGPSLAALKPTQKPFPSIATHLPFKLPEALDLARVADAEAYDFCRRHSWRVWLKGPYHEAVAVTNWRQLEAVRAAMHERWQTDRMSLQAHVRGFEESICLAARDGQTLDAIYMKKRVTTPEGKTWAGRVGDVPAPLLDQVQQAVAALEWTGGAEIELLRDLDGELWLMEWNPRFPAWIHGASITGRNLPGALVRAAVGAPFDCVSARSPVGKEFTRVVIEIPTIASLPLPIPSEPEHGALAAMGKYGAALFSVVPRLQELERLETAPDNREDVRSEDTKTSVLSSDLILDLKDGLSQSAATPQRFLLERSSKAAFATAAALRRTISTRGCRFQPAFSIKTCPEPYFLNAARDAGMWAECISQLEVDRALETGWTPAEIILNGPGKWWPVKPAYQDGLAAVFCDSLAELARLIESGRQDRVWGVRLRLPGFTTRFGVPVEDPEQFNDLADLVRRFPPGVEFGVHVHMASTLIGVGHWRDAVESAAAWAAALEMSTGHRVTVFDLGGGFHPDDFSRLPFADVVGRLKALLPHIESVFVEPGRALTQASMALTTSILDIRRRGDEITEVVVDACIAELPLASAYPHRSFIVGNDGALTLIGSGQTKILGRICMEDDVITQGVSLPAGLKIGDRIVIGDAGAYERSMSYEFGRGGYAAT